MSDLLLQEARTIGKQLSVAQKAQLIEWLSSDLHQALVAQTETTSVITPHPLNGHDNGYDLGISITTDQDLDEVEPTWTAAEISALMKPDPKTGAEIAAMIESGEIDTSIGAELDIPDVVKWLENLRRQERMERGLEA